MTSPGRSVFGLKRRSWRFMLETGQAALVEFNLTGGSHWILSLVEFSAAGIAFRLQDGCPVLAVGDEIDSAVLQLGDFRIVGSFRVVHVTPGPGGETICGARFTPSTEAAQRMLDLLLDNFEEHGHGCTT